MRVCVCVLIEKKHKVFSLKTRYLGSLLKNLLFFVVLPIHTVGFISRFPIYIYIYKYIYIYIYIYMCVCVCVCVCVLK